MRVFRSRRVQKASLGQFPQFGAVETPIGKGLQLISRLQHSFASPCITYAAIFSNLIISINNWHSVIA